MKLRILLYPFSIIYHIITATRNKLFDIGILQQKNFNIPIIGVGNLNTGGTGKTPNVAYIAKLLQKQNINVATLSRGYGRKSKGYILANKEHTALQIGDEPFELYHNIENLHVAVCENRINGVEELLKSVKPDAIILDDNFQHRYVKPSLQILLTSYDDFFYDDHILPAGNLRESISGASRADIVVISKCPENLGDEQKSTIKKNIYKYTQAPVFFSTYKYGSLYSFNNKNITTIKDIILVTGLANTDYLKSYIEQHYNIIEHLKYPDHYIYKEEDIKEWGHKYKSNFVTGAVIITTEKDAARLQAFNLAIEIPIMVLPIEVDLGAAEKEFDSLISGLTKTQ